MNGVSVITPSGGRPFAFSLCHLYVKRMADLHDGEIQWIVVDDCNPIEVERLESDSIEINRVFPRPLWQAEHNTLARNLLAAIPLIKHPKIIIIENDDWYSPVYLKQMIESLEVAEVVGEVPSYYYHIPGKRYRNMDNVFHASLCQTALRATALPILQTICETGASFIDVRFWKECLNRKLSNVMLRTRNCIGTKGLPGRPGIGAGHRLSHGANWRPDPDLNVLRSWIGEDVQFYYPTK